MVGIAAANIDPVVRPDPNASMQGNRAHLAFSGGAHECPGQDIGRAIADVGVDALLMRLPDVELALEEHELSWTGSLMSRHLDQLPVTFAPRPPQDIMVAPSPAAMPPPRTDWEVTSHAPAAPPSFRGPLHAAQAPPVPAPEPAAAVPAQRGSAPKRLWRAMTSWWRGY